MRTFGCQMNVYDSERMTEALSAQGYAETGDIEEADLVILNSNPLEDIRNTDDIRQVMLNGRLYDAATLNETVTGNRQRQPYFWEGEGGGRGGTGTATAHADD